MWLRSQTFLKETGNLKKFTHVQKGRELEATALCPWEEDDCSHITEPSAVEITSGKPPACAGSMKSTAAAKSTRQNCLDWSKKMSIRVMYSHFVSLHLELIFQYKALSTPPTSLYNPRFDFLKFRTTELFRQQLCLSAMVEARGQLPTSHVCL